MEPTTGLILRRITQTELSLSAHKLATVILDAIASKMGISRQYIAELLAELEASELELRQGNPIQGRASCTIR